MPSFAINSVHFDQVKELVQNYEKFETGKNSFTDHKL